VAALELAEERVRQLGALGELDQGEVARTPQRANPLADADINIMRARRPM
jgi:hypothetical protein